MSGNLNQYLQSTMSSIPVSTIRTLKKDTNNLAGPSKKIKKDKCKKFLKEYKLYVKGDISGWDGTKTNQLQIYCLDEATPTYSVTLLNW